MNPKSWEEMIKNAEHVDPALGDGCKKIQENEIEIALVKRRGLGFTKDLLAEHIIHDKYLFPLLPFHEDEFLPYKIDESVGEKFKMKVIADEYVRVEDIE